MVLNEKQDYVKNRMAQIVMNFIMNKLSFSSHCHIW